MGVSGEQTESGALWGIEVELSAMDPRQSGEDHMGGVATPPPHGARALAFGIDLIVVVLIALATGVGWPMWVGIFVGYHTVLLWLTGQTVGKAISNLEVRRVDGAAFVRVPRALPWALGRSSLGYLVVDAVGIGVLVALPRANTARRCLHDWVFGSQVVLRGELSWAIPKLRRRLSEFARRREDASKAVAEDHQDSLRLSGLWHWLVTGALVLEKLLDSLQSLVNRISGWFGGTSSGGTSSTVISSKAAVAVGAASSAVTAGTLAGFLAWSGPPAEAAIEGDWGSVVVQQVGQDAFEGRMSRPVTSKLGCIFEAGQVVWRFSGAGPDFSGTSQWAHLTDGECDGFVWGAATFELLDQGTPDERADDVLRKCETNPDNDEKDCDDLHRS